MHDGHQRSHGKNFFCEVLYLYRNSVGKTTISTTAHDSWHRQQQLFHTWNKHGAMNPIRWTDWNWTARHMQLESGWKQQNICPPSKKGNLHIFVKPKGRQCRQYYLAANCLSGPEGQTNTEHERKSKYAKHEQPKKHQICNKVTHVRLHRSEISISRPLQRLTLTRIGYILKYFIKIFGNMGAHAPYVLRQRRCQWQDIVSDIQQVHHGSLLKVVQYCLNAILPGGLHMSLHHRLKCLLATGVSLGVVKRSTMSSFTNLELCWRCRLLILQAATTSDGATPFRPVRGQAIQHMQAFVAFATSTSAPLVDYVLCTSHASWPFFSAETIINWCTNRWFPSINSCSWLVKVSMLANCSDTHASHDATRALASPDSCS